MARPRGVARQTVPWSDDRCRRTAGGDALALPHTDWLRHDLLVTGPPAGRGGFSPGGRRGGGDPLGLSGPRPWRRGPGARAAASAGWLARADACRGTGAGAAAAQRRRDPPVSGCWRRSGTAGRARSICTRSCRCRTTSCQRGPDDPGSRAWLRTHWGTTRALRHVRLHADHGGPAAAPLGTAPLRVLVGRLDALAGFLRRCAHAGPRSVFDAPAGLRR